jgi:hypothetical protein
MKRILTRINSLRESFREGSGTMKRRMNLPAAEAQAALAAGY